MGFFNKKADPISQRSDQLTAKIAELESRIQQLSRHVEPEGTRRFRSTAYPPGVPHPPAPSPTNGDPVFERVDRRPLDDVAPPIATNGHYNDMGARKFDFPEWLERVKRQFRGRPASNPKLVNYLAAGNIHGLRPLRFERRVARNKVIALTLLLVIVIFGLCCFLVRR
jgi:hypothetical protein